MGINEFDITLECPVLDLQVQAGEFFNIPIFIQNNGPEPFISSASGNYFLTYEWSIKNRTYFDINLSTPVYSKILPGHSSTVILRLYAPLIEGNYNLRIVFRQRGSSPIGTRELHGVIVTPNQQRYYANLFKNAIQKGLFTDALNYFKKDRGYFGIDPDSEIVYICRITSVKEWCRKNSLPYTTMKKAKKWRISPPTQAGLFKQKKIDGTIILPELYVAEVCNATIIGGEDVVISTENEALSDDPFPDIISYESGTIFYESLDVLVSHFWTQPDNTSFPIIEKGIFFCGLYSHNYFHWIVNFLPRLWMIDQCHEYDNFPLIISDNVPDNFIKALQYFDVRLRDIIRIKLGYPYVVKTLVIPSRFSNYHPHTYTSFREETISPDAVNFLREKLKIAQTQSGKRHQRWIYIQRENPNFRNLLNEKEIEALFERYGFEFIDPSELSISEQIDLFSCAEIIAGPHGAGWTNMIFAPANARGLMLMGSEVSYLYSNIANIIGQDLIHLHGETIEAEPLKIYFQYDFTIDIEKLEFVLEAFCGPYKECKDDTLLNDRGRIRRLDIRKLPELSGRTAFCVDQINREKISGEQIEVLKAQNNQIIVEGWAIDAAANAPASAVFLTFDCGQEYRAYYTLPRPDVGTYFKDESLTYTGFVSLIPIEDIPEGGGYFRIKIVTHNNMGFYYPQDRFSFKMIKE